MERELSKKKKREENESAALFLLLAGIAPGQNERARKVDFERVYWHNDAEENVPEHDDGKLVKRVVGVLRLSVVVQIARVEQHRG